VPLVFEALRALRSSLPAARLLLVGSGPLEDGLRARALADGLIPAVVFAGAVPYAEMPGFYAAADAFAFPSITETQGLVLAEAFAAGLPVVAIDNPQTRDVFGTHLAGEIVADAGEMTAALRSLLTDAERRHAAVAHARAAAAAFDARATAGRVSAVYEAVLANRAGTAEMAAFADLFDLVDIEVDNRTHVRLQYH